MISDSIKLKVLPKLACGPGTLTACTRAQSSLQLICKVLCLHLATVLVYTDMSLAALLPVATCSFCLPTSAKLYIVVSQYVATVAVVLEVHVLVETSKIYVACFSHRGISMCVL